jgi:type I restriction enzyme S subunit
MASGVDDKAFCVDNKASGVDDMVSGVDDKVSGVDDKVSGVNDKASGLNEIRLRLMRGRMCSPTARRVNVAARSMTKAGNMAGEWRETTLTELYDFCSGLSKPRSEFGSGYPFLSFKDVFYNTAVPKQLTELVQSSEQERARCSVRRGDVFLTRTSETIDELGMSSVALADIPDATFNGFTKRLRPKQEQVIAPEFARYYFRSDKFRGAVNAMSTMSTRASLNNEMLERLTISFPTYKEQEKIGGILGSLDDKIDLNRRMNETLEAMARALFKSWFVDFDGVAKADMQASELGRIPKGWRVASLDAHVDAARGLSYKGAGLAEAGAGVLMHNLNSVLEFGGYKYAGIKHYSGEYKEKHLAVAGDIIVANTEQGHEHRLIGFPAIVPGCHTSGLFSHHLYCVRIKAGSPITREWLYHCLMAPAVRRQIIGCTNGSTVNMLKPDGLKIPRFALPPHDLCEKFDAVAAPLRLKAEANIEQMETLAQLRDTLLPRLLSGQLRVKEAAEIAEGFA